MPGPSQVFPRAEALIEQGIAEGLHLGAQCYVSLNGDVVGVEAYGEAHPDHPMTSETILCWMSSVKPITAIAILRAVTDGLLDLDTPVAEWIPAFAEGGKGSVTVRHLLTHTAGFRKADQPAREESWSDALARICATPLEPDWAPGKRAGYQLDSSWHVLGELLQVVHDVSFTEVIKREVFDLAGMDAAWIGVPESVLERDRKRVGGLYVREQNGLKPHPMANSEAGLRAVRPGANGRGPMRALGHFYEDLLAAWLRDEGVLLSQDRIREATDRAREGLFDETFQHLMDWGLGFMPNNKRHGVDTVPYGFGRYASDAAFGHSGNQSSVAFADPEHELVVALAFNGMPGEPRHQRRIRAVLNALYEDLGLV